MHLRKLLISYFAGAWSAHRKHSIQVAPRFIGFTVRLTYKNKDNCAYVALIARYKDASEYSELVRQVRISVRSSVSENAMLDRLVCKCACVRVPPGANRPAMAQYQHHQQQKPQQQQQICPLASTSTHHSMHAPRLTSACSDQHQSDALRLALGCGLARFLRLEELLATLNSCALLRFDAALAHRSVAETADFDWFPAVLTDMAARASDSRRLHSLWETAADTRLLEPHGTVAVPQPALRVQVLALVAFLKKRAMRWCFVYESLDPDDTPRDVLCSVRPALIPIPGYERSSDAKQTALRLNALARGFGDAFTAAAPHATDRSRFGAHWENIHVDKQTGRAECRLCEAAHASVALYRRQAALFIERVSAKLSEQQRVWRSDGDAKSEHEVRALVEAFRRAHFPPDAYIAQDALSWTNAEVLAHMSRHRKLQLDGVFRSVQLLPLEAYASSDDVVRCLSTTYQKQCRSFYRPLKTQLARQFDHVGRAQVPVQQDGAGTSGRSAHEVEFVGGVDAATGLLCGVYCSFR